MARYSARFSIVFACMGALFGASSGCDDEAVNSLTLADASADTSQGGSAGTSGSGGSSGSDSGTNDSGGSGGSDASEGGSSLQICSRLGNDDARERLLRDFGPLVIGGIHDDCRVSRLVTGPRALTIDRFADQLLRFNRSFWGCDSQPLTGFQLVYQPDGLSQNDVDVLIEIYLKFADNRLSLSPNEHQAMRAELERLGKAAVSSDGGLNYDDCEAGTPDAGDAKADSGDTEAGADANDGASSDGAELGEAGDR